MADVNGFRDFREAEPIIALDEDRTLRAIGVNRRQTREQILPGDFLPVNSAPERRSFYCPAMIFGVMMPM